MNFSFLVIGRCRLQLCDLEYLKQLTLLGHSIGSVGVLSGGVLNKTTKKEITLCKSRQALLHNDSHAHDSDIPLASQKNRQT